MAALRAFLILAVVLIFFLIGAPLQWLIGRRAPALAPVIPRLFCRAVLRLAKVRVVVSGRQAGPGPTLVVANHVSWLDILALGALAPFCFLAKSDIAGWPIVSVFADVQGTVFVDRRQRRSIVPANLRMAERMLANRAVLLFPEGTTFAGPQPGPFRSSHFAAARDVLRLSAGLASVAVQPLAISYSAASAAWVGDDALLPHLWRLLRGPPIRCAVTFGAPIAYTLGSDRKTVAALARSAVVDLLAASPVQAAAAAPPPREIGALRSAAGRA